MTVPFWPLFAVGWLVISTVFLLDTHVMLRVFGDGITSPLRQRWLAAALAFIPTSLLLSPWRLWVALALATVVTGRLLWHVLVLRRWRQQLSPAPAAFVARLQTAAGRWGAPQPWQVLLSPTPHASPAAFGLWRIGLVFPVTATRWSDADLDAALAHELAHVRHRDPLKVWLAGIAHFVAGWHPLVRSAAGHLHLELELAADWQAARWLGDPSLYARRLGELALRQTDQAQAIGLTGRPNTLLFRLRRLIDPETRIAPLFLPRWHVPVADARSLRSAVVAHVLIYGLTGLYLAAAAWLLWQLA